MGKKQTLFRLLLALLIALPLVLTACGDDDKDEGDSTPKTTITISGAFALYPMVVKWTEEYAKLHPDVKFDVSAGGAGKGMSDVLAGAVDLAMVSREVRDEEKTQGAMGFAVTKDAVVATVNANNPLLDTLLTTGLTPEVAAKIWISQDSKTWGDVLGSDSTEEVHVYTRADACGAAEVWSLFLGGTAQEDLKGIAVQGDPGLAEAVHQDTLGIGFNNIGYAYDLTTGKEVEGIRVVPIDLNGDSQISDDENFYGEKSAIAAAIADGRYPSPPARALYLVTKGKPNAAITAFIEWTLNDGQQYIDAAGYIQLTAEQLQASKDALKAE
jgi:phosphate transport system substrate-binding protein